MSDIEEVSQEEIFEKMINIPSDQTYWRQNERIALVAIVELIKCGKASFLFLKDDGVKSFYEEKYKSAKQSIIRKRKALVVYEQKLKAYLKLTDAERTALKIKKPIRPK